ncbi:MAG TPA: complex I NDUFA9 subunit family protein [Allosphingosinicella sp.]
MLPDTFRLVTLFGGGGFLGRYVAQALYKTGARVRIVQRDPRQAFFLKPLGALGQTQFGAVDIRNRDQVRAAVEGSDAVVNLVGTLQGDFEGLHVDGARNIAQAAIETGVGSLVQISAIGADADSPSRYGRTKGEGERAVQAAFPSATIVRPSIVFGREDQFVNRFADMIAKAPVVPVLRAGVKFQPVFAGDVGDAIAALVADPLAHAGRTYELGGPDVIAMGALIRWIAEAIGRSPQILELPDFAGDLISRAGFLPLAPITRDQWLMLQHDNVVAEGTPGLAALGVQPTPLAAAAPAWLVRFRRQGRFGARAEQIGA